MKTVEINGKMVTFALEVDYNGELELVVVAVDDGPLEVAERVLWIESDGTLNRFNGVDDITGLTLNKQGAIKKGWGF